MNIFVYGTLLEGLARGEAARLRTGIGPGKPASVAGELRLAEEEERGCYPLLVPGLAGRAYGEVIDCPDDPAWLDELDAYEGADYFRTAVSALLADGSSLQAQAYLYLGEDFQAFPLIAHGDFARFVRESGCKVFGH
ncbi:MAG TPA: gamma-glutamylcyclotransferase family protein [Sphingomonadaceae bacterium]|nr:gamma-glutamylcyclotransferase family protein [Sphingomonadaceae bacterium]